MTWRSSAAWTISVALAVVGGCAPTLPNGKARAPNVDVPASFDADPAAIRGSLPAWREFFTDPKLRALIDAALQNNQELLVVSQEVELASYEIMARKGELYPKLGAQVGVGIDKVGAHTSQGRSDEANGVPAHLPAFGFGLVASWEIDIWSKLRNATKAALARYLSSQEGRSFAVTKLVAEIAGSYYELIALDASLALVQQNIALQTDALAMVRLQKEAARVTELAVQRFEAEVLKNQSRQYAIRQQLVEVENRVNFLVGRFPQHVERSALAAGALLPPIIHAGVPAQLLENRPDVRQAQLALVASDFDTRSAKAAFYPTVGLNANLGYQAFDFLKLVATPASLVYGIAADLLAPLLNRKALTATYFSANARQKQAVFNYERAILNAIIEVAKQLALIHNLERGYELQAQQVERLTRSIELSTRLFASARADYMEVLLTRRDALESQMELVENRKRQMLAAIGLYQALGGGWR